MSDNPVALIVVAHIRAIDTRDDPEARQQGRLQLSRIIYERWSDSEEQRVLLGIVELLLDLPEHLEQATIETLLRERNPTMPRETSFERHARVGGEAKILRDAIPTLLEVRLGSLPADLPDLLAAAQLPALQRAWQVVRTASLDEIRAVLTTQPEG